MRELVWYLHRTAWANLGPATADVRQIADAVSLGSPIPQGLAVKNEANIHSDISEIEISGYWLNTSVDGSSPPCMHSPAKCRLGPDICPV